MIEFVHFTFNTVSLIHFLFWI